MLNFSVMFGTVAAWVTAVLFAYVTNRKWVFRSEARGKDILKEFSSFFACRLITGVIDWLCMFIFVELLNWNDVIIKFLANCIVIVINYIASKLIIFKKN
jgi:putative flippase GtrA